ncbi:Hypothetical protein NCS54_01157600 [Fusarium falciforme]|uniref:Hypothetical protein n=1 Tax=Fusarium falciforme TaxID=195108 RepID=UPI00230174D2|nr:Hypothetical protein NCS54_01157600 [Fusarium falciforme]WAO94014.1 Hypothetical protein NCS54_01157600 [Fusarium falciforme]
MSPYSRILSRFFEFLALFSILRKAEGPHVIINYNLSTLEATRRRFLRNLCFICDYKKGGDTTTSIAVEDQPDCFMFWMAGNVTPTSRVVDFLDRVLDSLQGAEALDELHRKELEDRLTEDSVQFGTARIQKECNILRNATRKCQIYLSTTASSTMTSDLEALKSWLPQFRFDTTADALPLCHAAYRAREDPQMTTLQVLSREDSATLEHAKSFQAIRHFVGRLAERIRVPKQLVEDASRLGTLLSSYHVAAVPAPQPEIVPPPDVQTTLHSITRRILSAGDPRIEEFQEFLTRLDEQTGLETKVRTMYDRGGMQSRVHAELQMLEFFHRDNRVFVENDRYIACSKLACLCCKLYFRHHPGFYVEPDSHQKVYTNWRPIILHEAEEDSRFPEQRALLGKVGRDIGNMLQEHIALQQTSAVLQQDSITNITTSEDMSFDSSDFEYESFGEYETDEETAPATEAGLKDDEESSDSDGESQGGVTLL